MKSMPGRPAGVLLLLALLLALPSVAQAYLDPGTGSYILQLILGTVLGGLFALGMFRRRVAAWVRRLFKRGSGTVQR